LVSLVRNPAKVGQEFGILGQGLKGTTSVSLIDCYKIQSKVQYGAGGDGFGRSNDKICHRNDA
jgi:hypothetical protein